MKAIIIEESVTVKRNGKQHSVKSIIELKWSNKHQEASEAVKRAVIENVSSGGDDNRQYRLYIDALKISASDMLLQLRKAEADTPVTKYSWEEDAYHGHVVSVHPWVDSIPPHHRTRVFGGDKGVRTAVVVF